MIDCISRYAELFPTPAAGAVPGRSAIDDPIVVTMSELLQLGSVHGHAGSVSSDAIAGACNRSYARKALPRQVTANLRLPDDGPGLEEVVVGVARAAQAHGVHVRELAALRGSSYRLEVRLSSDAVHAPTRASSGDCIVGIAANGLHEAGHQAALRAVPAAAPDRTQYIADVFCPVRAYGSVLHQPLTNNWFRTARVVDERGFDAAIDAVIPAPLRVHLDPARLPLFDVRGWMTGKTPIANNRGVGILLIVPPDHSAALLRHVALWGEEAVVLGTVAGN